jgi:tyrosine-protein phosphatase SIW14
MKKGFFLIVTLFCFQAFSRSAHAFSASVEDLPRFHEVDQNQIYRGAQPTENGFVKLRQLGIKTVLDLRNEDPSQIAQEKSLVESLGMRFISVPLSGFFSPKVLDMARIHNVMSSQALKPIFVHCQHGQDRTGLVVALHRIFSENIPVFDAKAEMIQLGFNQILFGLNHYFEEHAEEQQ